MWNASMYAGKRAKLGYCQETPNPLKILSNLEVGVRLHLSSKKRKEKKLSRRFEYGLNYTCGSVLDYLLPSSVQLEWKHQ